MKPNHFQANRGKDNALSGEMGFACGSAGGGMPPAIFQPGRQFLFHHPPSRTGLDFILDLLYNGVAPGARISRVDWTKNYYG
jgi:hypothetical protein